MSKKMNHLKSKDDEDKQSKCLTIDNVKEDEPSNDAEDKRSQCLTFNIGRYNIMRWKEDRKKVKQ